MENKKLTDIERIVTLPPGAIIHVVIPSDTSQSPEGSSYAIEVDKLPAASQDNQKIRKTFQYLTTDTDTQILAKLNALPQYIVNDKQSVLFIGTSVPSGDNSNVQVVKYQMMNKGKGTYGVGATQLAIADIELVYKSVAAEGDIEDDPNTDIVNFGSIVIPIQDWLNNRNPAIAIQPQSEGYTLFKGSINSVIKTYLWVGAAGVYGFANSQSTVADFQLLEDKGTLPGRITKTITTSTAGYSAGVYTLQVGDDTKWLSFNISTGTDYQIRVPANVFESNAEFEGDDSGTARATFVAGSGLTLERAADELLKVAARRGTFGIKYKSATQALVFGKLELI